MKFYEEGYIKLFSFVLLNLSKRLHKWSSLCKRFKNKLKILIGIGELTDIFQIIFEKILFIMSADWHKKNLLISRKQRIF